MNVISLILWVPYALPALILTISFLLIGRKRGTVRALLSLASTLVLGVLALLSAKVIAPLLADPCVRWFSLKLEDAAENLTAPTVQMLLTAITEMLLTVVLYGLLLLLLECVGKNVTAHFSKKITESKPVKGWNIVGGLLISLADALILAYLFVMPLYGTLSLSTKAVTTVAALDEETVPEDIFTVAKEVDRHPMILAVRTKPCSWAYDKLTTIRFGSGRMSLSRVADRALTAAVSVAELRKGELSEEKQLALIDAFEDLLISGGDATGELLAGMTDLLGDRKELGFLTDFLTEISANGTTEQNIHALADLARAAAQNGLLTIESTEENVLLNALSDRGFLGRVTQTLNATPEMAHLKNNLVETVLKSMNTDDYDAIGRLAEQITSKPVTDTEREADALYQIITALKKTRQTDTKDDMTAVADLLEGLARHPNLGPETVTETARELLSGENVPEALKSDEFMDVLEKRLAESTEKPVGDGTLAPFVESAVKTGEAVSQLNDSREGAEEKAAEAFASLITAEKDVVKDMAKVLSENLLVSSGMNKEKAGKMNDLLKDTLEIAADTEVTREQAALEGEKMAYVLSSVNKIGEGTDTEQALPDKQKFIDSIVTSRVLSDTVSKQVVKTDGTFASDPSGLFEELSVGEKQDLQRELDTYRGTRTVTEEQQKTLDQLAAFMGL